MAKLHEDAAAFLRSFRTLSEFATSVVDSGVAEQGVKDLTSEKEKIAKARDELKDEIDELAEEKQKALTAIDDAKIEAKSIIKQAQIEARQIRIDDLELLATEKENIQAEIAELKIADDNRHTEAATKYAELVREVDAKQAELVVIQNEIDALRSKFA